MENAVLKFVVLKAFTSGGGGAFYLSSVADGGFRIGGGPILVWRMFRSCSGRWNGWTVKS